MHGEYGGLEKNAQEHFASSSFHKLSRSKQISEWSD